MFKPKGVMFVTLVIMLMALSCSSPESDQPLLTAEVPLHLEEHIDDARIEGSEVPADLPEPVEWRFDEPQSGWKATTPRPFPAGIRPAAVSQTDDALQITLGPSNASPDGRWLVGGAYVEVMEWDHRDWAHLVIQARSSGPGTMVLGFNVNPDKTWKGTSPDDPSPYEMEGDETRLVGDSAVQTYQLPLEPQDLWEEPIKQLGFWAWAREPLTVEILSITVVPMDALYAEEPAGIRHVERDNQYRRSLFVHTPAQIEYRVQVPAEGRLDLSLGTLWSELPTTFRVTVRADGEQAETLLEESHDDRGTWAQNSIDLSAYAGQVVTLSLEVESGRDGSVALWGAPTLTGTRATDKPNVIFYIIDGAGAEYMSVYSYNRRTTPNIERLAAEGALFERAYSNSTWTRPSNVSFMTSLQHSVLGGFKNGFNVVPDDAQTMAQHMHRAGYQTAVFVSNPNAGRMSGLDRGVDVMREAGVERDLISSVELHEDYWSWRDAYPAQPYWVHFQTTDVHEYETGQPEPVPPFSGLFVTPERRQSHLEHWDRFKEWFRDNSFTGNRWRTGIFAETGIDRIGFFDTMRSLYDESMAHQDYQIGRLVERLKAAGEWENTLLIIAADHSVTAALWDLGVLLQDSLPPAWNNPMLRPTVSRVPFIVVWPGHIAGGQRFREPVVSMIDVLPTILDLVGLPLPVVMQGQSLAPMLLGEGNVEPRPVILDEFEVDGETGEFRGRLEVVDGRWGASLEINPKPPEEDEEEEMAMRRRPVPLLLYDLWNDPYCLHSVHKEHPDLVEKYTAFLEEQWEAHQAMGQYFTPSEAVLLTPEQLEALRALGYIK